MLKGFAILVAEENSIIAMHLARAIEQAGGRPLWPIKTLASALEAVHNEEIRAALVSVAFADVALLVRRLKQQAIPFLIHSSDGAAAPFSGEAETLPHPVKWSSVISVLTSLPNLLN